MSKIWKYDFDIAKFTKAMKINPKDFTAYKDRGNAYYKKGLFALAISDYSKAIELNPLYFIAYNNRGNVFQQTEQYDLAIADYNMTIKLKPNNGMPYNNRGFTFLLMGRLQEAEADIIKSLELNQNNIYALNSMSELCALKKNTKDSCKWLKMAIDKGYNNWNYIRTAKTYDNIRNSPCFKEIISKISSGLPASRDSKDRDD